MFQAARLTQQLAREGRAEKPAFAASINSLLMLDAAVAAEVYGGVGGVKFGLQLVRDKFTAGLFAPSPAAGGGHGERKPALSAQADIEIARYVVSLIHLEGALRKRPEILAAIRRGIEAIESQMKFFEPGEAGDAVHPRLVDKLAELYTQTISTLSPRIMVNGEHDHLADPTIAAKVRAALFAGMRSAVLWRQKGGSRWQLLFGRRKIGQEAGRPLAEPPET